ncbi:MAG: T9SS type A sorting domain-containing protein [Candidatus Fermentibacteria bacterium]|nr:T9SS type A sorting domain-containing protein [Candidatus Fermentibacteria bacterium]
MIEYYYYPYPFSDPVYDYEIYKAPGGVNMDFSEELCTVAQAEDFALSDNASFTILSNPVGETLDVEISGDIWNLSVFDISGRCVVSESGVSTEVNSVISIDAGALPSGVYMLKVEIEGVEQFQSITVVH